MKRPASILVVSFLLCFSCAKKKTANHDGLLGLDYYPTETGKYVIYDVDSVIYSDLPQDTVTYSYRIKERIADSFTDNEGRPAIRMERFIKKYNPQTPYDQLPWTIKEVWLVNATKQSIQVVEGNVRYTKLVFPIEAKNSWNGNANNTIGEWHYTIDYIEKKETVNQTVLEKVLRVDQKDFKTLISWQYYSEKYAKGVGLVSREITDIYSNNIQPGVPVENRIEKGLIYKQLLVSYGYE